MYGHYADALMSIAFRYARDIPEAEDILQNAFVNIFTHLKSLRDPENALWAWMKQIVIREALSRNRKNKHWSFEGNSIPDVSDECADSVIEKLAAEELMKLINEIPDDYRTVFVLYVVDEYNHEEIGKMLGIKTSSSRSRLTRAKKMIRELVMRLQTPTSKNY